MEDLGTLKSAIIVLSVMCLLLPWPVFAYFDDGKAHPAINDIAFEKFANEWMPNDPSLKNCSLDRGKVLPGPAWDLDMGISYLGQIEPQIRSKTIKDWLKSGGFSADEPEVPKAIRHFYTPVGEVPYITDFKEEFGILNKFKATCLGVTAGATALSGPGGGLIATGVCAVLYGGLKIYVNWEGAGEDINDLLTKGSKGISALDWTFDHPDNLYSFSRAKEYYKTALSLSDSSAESQLSNYSKAWRAVGETMHMISDMTVPAHVRNDGHGVTSDPYERYATADRIMKFSDPVLFTPASSLDYGRKTPGKDLKALMKDVATWTNENFFSKDTITKEGQTTTDNGMPAFPSPKADKFYTEKGNTYYYRFIDGQKIELAHRPWTWMLWKDAELELDARVLAAQRSILIPTAIQASSAVLDAFLPRFEVTIDNVEEDNSSGKDMKKVEGHIKHIPNPEWPASIDLVIRNGAYIKVIDKEGKVTLNKIPCPEGGNLNNVEWKGQLKPGDEVTLEYNLGGYVIRSKPYKLEQGKPETNVIPVQDCGGIDYSKLHEEWDSGLRAQYYVDQNGTIIGLYTEYYDDEKKYIKERGCHGPITYDEYGIPVSPQNGRWTTWYKNGTKESEGYLKDYLKTGHWTTWYENGNKVSEEDWKDEKLIHQTRWYENGNKENEGDFVNGNTTNLRAWYEDGNIKEEFVANGHSVSYYDNGNKQEEGDRKDGIGIGHWIYWYEDGSKRYEMDY